MCLALVVALSVVTWPAIMAEASKIGNGGVMGALYPFQMDGIALAGALMLLIEACDRKRLSLVWCVALFVGLGMAAIVSFHSGVHGWVGMVTAAVPGVAIAVITPFMIIRGRQAASQQANAS